MDPFDPHLPTGHFRPEAYIAPDPPPRAARATPGPGSAYEADRDRRPNHPAYDEPTIELGFADFLDIINPLQHIPLVGDIYRALTGDQITGPARIVGGVIFGGPVGFLSGIFNAIADDAAGQTLGEAVVAAVFGDDDADPDLAQTAVAAAAPDVGAPDAGAALGLVGANQVVVATPAAFDTDQPRQTLTGAAALQALGADLRMAGRRLDSAETLPGAPTGTPAGALAEAPAGADPVFTNRMLEGLNKYKALVTERNTSPAPPIISVGTI